MATGAAADGLFRPIYEGCISGFDNDVERRPYHKNCGCALHSKKKSNKPCTHKMRRSKVSYPMRRAWSDGSLAVASSSATATSAHSSPSSSPAAAGFRHDEEPHSHRLGVLFEM
ncbi:hypothetical protein VNO78_03070 [Psophocarpus tetragonolobus]|uniref:Uncharacterized protein n=1 Tax=Psophocarpus tetragonolobus TaxID=3891 RepID=A0AAN9TD95_PSOTE